MSAAAETTAAPAAPTTYEPQQVIEAGNSDDSGSDTSSIHDSLYSEDGSITDTLRSAWLRERIKHEHGRKYVTSDVSKATYIPIDETQLDQLDICHQVYLDGLSIHEDPRWKEGMPYKFFRSPIGENPQKILDVGTGTGLWCIDVGDRYPSSQVVGFDNAPVQPSWVPPNVNFELEDVENDLTYTPGSFDLVHARAMHAAVANWERFCVKIFKIVKAGGYFEIHSEVPFVHSDDDTIPKNWGLVKWLELMEEGLNKIGLSMYNVDKHIEEYLEKAGFTDISRITYKVPIGPWPKDARLKKQGAMFLVNLLQGLEGWTLTIFTKILGWEHDAVMKFIEEVKKSLRNKKAHTYMRFNNFVARKPGNSAPPPSEHVVQ